MAVTVAVRAPRDRDVDAMADQAGQLGYPVQPDELRRRLAAVTAKDDAAVLVATDPQDRAIGWLHVELKRTLVAPLTAQIIALIVDERVRGGGVGRELVAAADAWALACGCQRLMVATRVTRERAHRFYLREGFSLDKTSHIFERPLAR
ncbi:MAG TPA: GNAT family N-acetyltransferase [Candidatus Limnocylindria bacterium]|nr:GNAT family N-acetyltransferase [Candidatus Limnocylindria bacterium]